MSSSVRPTGLKVPRASLGRNSSCVCHFPSFEELAPIGKLQLRSRSAADEAQLFQIAQDGSHGADGNSSPVGQFTVGCSKQSRLFQKKKDELESSRPEGTNGSPGFVLSSLATRDLASALVLLASCMIPDSCRLNFNRCLHSARARHRREKALRITFASQDARGLC
jgi:hypothetical protein